jgi:hypothetical protein
MVGYICAERRGLIGMTETIGRFKPAFLFVSRMISQPARRYKDYDS